MRRSFRGNSVYTVVFTQYLAAIMARGHSIEYFIEGGRSRSGRLLAPMTGMLAMTVRSYLRQPRRPVVFLPVYFGYERIWEGATYINELAGLPKEKESVLGLVRSVHGSGTRVETPSCRPITQGYQRLLRQGEIAGPKNELSFEEPIANSSLLSLPSITAPSRQRWALTVDS